MRRWAETATPSLLDLTDDKVDVCFSALITNHSSGSVRLYLGAAMVYAKEDRKDETLKDK